MVRDVLEKETAVGDHLLLARLESSAVRARIHAAASTMSTVRRMPKSLQPQ
jgi:hypothetical protein